MLIIGCDYHPGFQQIALVDTETGEGGKAAGSSGRDRAVLPQAQRAKLTCTSGGGSQRTTHAGLSVC